MTTLQRAGEVRGLPIAVHEAGRMGSVEQVAEAEAAEIYSDSDAIISVDSSHRITAFNDVARLIFGYSAEEILGSPLEVLIPERFREVHLQHVARFADGQSTMRHMAGRKARIYGRRKNGEEFAAAAAISKIEVDGRMLLTVCLHDISEERRSEEGQRLLAEAGEILVRAGSDYQRLLTEIANVIVRNIADWCAIEFVHADGVQRIRVVHSDPAEVSRCQAFESQPNERRQPDRTADAITSPCPLLVQHPSRSVLKSLASGDRHFEVLIAFDPGSLMVVPLVARGHSLGTLTFGYGRSSRRYDIRDLREAQELANRVALAVDNARLHETLERAIQARDDILGIVAHDLRNPLNAIMLRARMLRRREGAPERRDQSAADGIHRSAVTMHRLIADLLDVCRLEAGQSLSISPKVVETKGVLAEAIERQLAAYPVSHRELRLDIAQDIPSVWADRTRLLQVFDNLLGNAIKFSRKQVMIGAGVKEGHALFWVSDDGPGIDAEDLPRLFDRFWQASRTDRLGAGLGLSIVQGIIRAHGGTIWVESKVNSGTTFYFTLPGEPAPAPDSDSVEPLAT